MPSSCGMPTVAQATRSGASMAAVTMTASPLLQSYLQITEETDRLMGFTQAPDLPAPAPAPAPAPPPVDPAPVSAAPSVPRRRTRSKRQLGPGRRAKLASRVALQQSTLRENTGDEDVEKQNLSMPILSELSADLLSHAAPDAVASGDLRKGQTNALAAARDTRLLLKQQGFRNAAEAFAFADKDKDGLLAAPAVAEWLHQLGLPDGAAVSVLEQLARGRVRDGCIDARQWLRVFNHPSWGRLPSQVTALRAVSYAAAPVGRASIRERVETRSALFERRSALESVGQGFKVEIEESKSAAFAADYMTEDDLLLGAQRKLDGEALLNLAGQECANRGLKEPADAFWFFADSVDGGAGGQSRVNALRHPADKPPPLHEDNLALGLAALKITSVDPFELLYALTEHEGGRVIIEPPTFLQHWGGRNGTTSSQKKLHPFAIKADLLSAGRPTRRATIRAAVRKVQELVTSGQVVLADAEDLVSKAKDAADGVQNIRKEVEFAAAAAEGEAARLVEESYSAAQRKVRGIPDLSDKVPSGEDGHTNRTNGGLKQSDISDWKASQPPAWRVVPVHQDKFYGDPIFAPYDQEKHEAQRLADKEKSAQILAQGGAVGTVRIRRRQSHEIISQLRQELKKRGFKNAAEAFVFFDDNSNEVLVLIDFRRAFRRLELDRLMSVEEAFRAIEDPHHQCGAIHFVKSLSWGKKGFPRSIPRALRRAEKARNMIEERVHAAVDHLRREHSDSIGPGKEDRVGQLRKKADKKRHQVRRAGQNAIRMARKCLQDRGFVDCAEAFAFLDTAGENGGFLSHVELELGFRTLGLLVVGAENARRAISIRDTEAEHTDDEDEDDEKPRREQLNVYELQMALDAGGMFDGQTSYTEFVRHFEWGPLRHKPLHEQNAALDDAMMRRKAIRNRILDAIAQEVATQQAILDARTLAAKQSRSLAKQALSMAKLHADGNKCVNLLRKSVEKIKDAAVQYTDTDAAALFDNVLDTMDDIAQVLVQKHIDDDEVEQTAESAAHESERAEQSAKSADGIFAVISLVPHVCASACKLDDDIADEESEVALKLPDTPKTLEEVSMLVSWRLITHPGAGLLRQRLARARIGAAGEVAVAVAIRAQAAAAASPTRAGQEPSKELALRSFKQALDIDATNCKAIEELPAAEVAWRQVITLRKQETDEKSAHDRVNNWIDVSGMSDYGFFGSEQRRPMSGSEIAAQKKSESKLRDTPAALQPKPPGGSKPKHSVAAEVSSMTT